MKKRIIFLCSSYTQKLIEKSSTIDGFNAVFMTILDSGLFFWATLYIPTTIQLYWDCEWASVQRLRLFVMSSSVVYAVTQWPCVTTVTSCYVQLEQYSSRAALL